MSRRGNAFAITGNSRESARTRIAESTSLRAVSRALGISAATLSSLLLHNGRKPGPKILRALGYERLEMYRRVK